MSDVLELVDVSVVRDGRALVDQVSWSIAEGQRWVILGPNGAGKTTLLNIASSYLFPTSGTVSILGEKLGGVDVFELRPRIGIAGVALSEKLPRRQTVLQTVLTAAYGMTATWQEHYEKVDEDRARAFLDRLGMSDYLDRKFGTLSEGERKRTLIARAMMTDPELLLLDEPAAGLDLGGREDLVRRLGRLARDPIAPSMVMVTHHVEEIAPGFTHVLMIRQGKVVAAGPMDDTLTSRNLSHCFGPRWSWSAAATAGPPRVCRSADDPPPVRRPADGPPPRGRGARAPALPVHGCPDTPPGTYDGPVDAWVGWLIAAVALGIPLVVTAMPEFGMFAIGAVAAAVATGVFGMGLIAQVLVFVIVSVALISVVRPIANRSARSQAPELRSGVDALKGRQALVLERVDSQGGRIKLGGEVWSARTLETGQVFEAGAQVDVIEIDGATAVVI
jgi:iron complex transport system ATP-binding protein